MKLTLGTVTRFILIVGLVAGVIVGLSTRNPEIDEPEKGYQEICNGCQECEYDQSIP